jgi:hypothetical protein
MRTLLTILLTLSGSLSAVSQAQPAAAPEKAAPHVEVATVAADPKDVSSIDGMIRAYYDVISGPAGQPRQWSRDRSLYMPDTHFTIVGADTKGQTTIRSVNHQQFVDSSDAALVKRGFYEQEIHRVTQHYGNIAQVFSTYESREKLNGPVIERGINSIELVYDGNRWWITAANWQDESKEYPIPAQFLPTNAKPPHSE